MNGELRCKKEEQRDLQEKFPNEYRIIGRNVAEMALLL
jgi:hypothetical protein